MRLTLFPYYSHPRAILLTCISRNMRDKTDVFIIFIHRKTNNLTTSFTK